MIVALRLGQFIFFAEVDADVLSGGECLEGGVHGGDQLKPSEFARK